MSDNAAVAAFTDTDVDIDADQVASLLVRSVVAPVSGTEKMPIRLPRVTPQVTIPSRCGTASTFLVPETRGRDLLRTEDAIGLSQTEQDTATDILAPSGVVLGDDDGGHAASAAGTDDQPPASGTN